MGCRMESFTTRTTFIIFFFFFLKEPPPTEIYPLPLPAALPIFTTGAATAVSGTAATLNGTANPNGSPTTGWMRYATTNPGSCNDTFGTRIPATGGTSLGSGSRSEEHTSELQSQSNIVCRLLLEI